MCRFALIAIALFIFTAYLLAWPPYQIHPPISCLSENSYQFFLNRLARLPAVVDSKMTRVL
jgi:hypothetical protein